MCNPIKKSVLAVNVLVAVDVVVLDLSKIYSFRGPNSTFNQQTNARWFLG